MDFDLSNLDMGGSEGIDSLLQEQPARPKEAKVRVASLSRIASFDRVNKETLIHKSTRDLWTFQKEGDSYYIERLFDQNGEPIKG